MKVHRTRQVTFRMEWGFHVPPMKGFAATLAARPGGPLPESKGKTWYTSLGTRGATIESVHEGNGVQLQTLNGTTWKTRHPGNRSASLVLMCRIPAKQPRKARPPRPRGPESFLEIRTHPQRAEGFCIDLHELLNEKTIYAPSIGYFFSTDPSLSCADYIKARNRRLKARHIPSRTIVEVAGRKEQTIAEAAQLVPGFKQYQTFIGWPAFPNEFVIWRNGDFAACQESLDCTLWKPGRNLTVCVGAGRNMDFRRGLRRTFPQEMNDGFTCNTSWRSDGLDIHEAVFAYPLKGVSATPFLRGVRRIDHRDWAGLKAFKKPAAPNLVVLSRFRVTNRGKQARTGHLWFTFTGTGFRNLPDRPAAGLPWFRNRGRDQPEYPYEGELRLEGNVLWTENRIRAMIHGEGADISFHSAVGPQSGRGHAAPSKAALAQNLLHNVIHAEFVLQPGESRALELVVPYNSLPKSKRAALQSLRFEATRARASSYWDSINAQGLEIQTPGNTFNDVHRSVIRHVLPVLDAEADGRLLAKCTPMRYESVWVTVGAKLVTGLVWNGHYEWAKRLLDPLLEWQGFRKPAGEINSREGYFTVPPRYDRFRHLNHNGMMLWAASEYYRFTRDNKWLRKYADKLIAGCDWIIREREAVKKRLGNPDTPGWGLMPYGQVTDQGQGRYFFSDITSCHGLLRAGEFLAEIHHAEAPRIQKQASEYRVVLRKWIRYAISRRALVKLNDETWIPFVPPTLDGTGRDAHTWYPNQVDLGPMWMMEFGIIEHDEPWMDFLLNDHEDNLYVDGLGDEPYLSCQYLPYLLRDEIPNFVRALVNQTMIGMSPTQMRWEHRSWGEGTIYDLANADLEYSRRVIQMLMLQHRKEIRLAWGTPRQWLQNGKKITVRGMPTYHGSMSYEIESHVGEGYVRATIWPPQRDSNHPMKLRLRLPGGRTFKGVTMNNKEWKDFDAKGETVTLPKGKRKLEVLVWC